MRWRCPYRLCQPHFLDQPILQGLVGALHAPLGLRGVGRDAFNTPFTCGAGELRFRFRVSLFGIDMEDAGSVAVECYWLANWRVLSMDS